MELIAQTLPSLLLVSAILLQAAAQTTDKYTDENRPYEFGFVIEGQQHRHEKKDEAGIITGEFGFVTADGIYHVTVYATDENGDFKIISMKNVRVAPSPFGNADGNFKTAPPPTSSYKVGTTRPPVYQQTSTPAIVTTTTKRTFKVPNGCSNCLIPTTTTTTQPPLPLSLNRESKPPPLASKPGFPFGSSVTTGPPRAVPAVPGVRPFGDDSTSAGPPQSGRNFGTFNNNSPGGQQPSINTANFPINQGTPRTIPPADSQPLPGPLSGRNFGNFNNNPPDGQQPSINTGNIPINQGTSKTKPPTDLQPPFSADQQPLITNINSGVPLTRENISPTKSTIGQSFPQTSQPFNTPGSSAPELGGGVSSRIPTDDSRPQFPNTNVPSSTAPQIPGTNTGFAAPPSSSNKLQPQDPNLPPFSPPRTPELNLSGNPPPFNPNTDVSVSSAPQNPNYNIPGSSAPKFPTLGSQGNPFPEPRGDVSSRLPTDNTRPRLPDTNVPSSVFPLTPRANNGDGVPPPSLNPPSSNTPGTPSGRTTPSPIGVVRDGPPPGVSLSDVMNLLYIFNYTVGFHGHHESGYTNGDKQGGYFVNGRDGIGRNVNYIANEFGYQPNITLVNLGLDSPDTPKQDTEKEYGLKGYEFKWFSS